jgi:hypothetical protein
LSPPLQAAIRRAHTQREAALELRDLADEPVRDAPRLEQVPREVEQFGAAARSPRPRPCVLFNYNERIVMPQEDPLDQCSPELRAEFDELMRHAERVGAVDSYPSRDIARSHVTLLRPCRERVVGAAVVISASPSA